MTVAIYPGIFDPAVAQKRANAGQKDLLGRRDAGGRCAAFDAGAVRSYRAR